MLFRLWKLCTALWVLLWLLISLEVQGENAVPALAVVIVVPPLAALGLFFGLRYVLWGDLKPRIYPRIPRR